MRTFFDRAGAFPLVIAHRGASADALENSLPAIARASAAGADMVEVDVRLTADGAPVVIHDPRTGRTGKENVRVGTASLSRLRRVALKDGGTVPTLAEALAAAGALPVVLDIKVAGGMEAACREVAAAPPGGGVLLSSGLREECLAARRLRPDLPCGLVVRRPSASDLAFCLANGIASVHADVRTLSPLRLRMIRGSGLRLLPYVVDDPALFRAVAAAGAAGAFTNRPSLLAACR